MRPYNGSMYCPVNLKELLHLAIGEIDTGYWCRMNVEMFCGSQKDSYKYSDGDVHSSNEVSSDENGGSEESDHKMQAPVGGKRLQSSIRGKQWKRG